ncbi:hypothetical protein AGMMS49942_00910 [Spirochaetia bacterium]|nr:hypothetical protein AGMMS49942_00910 [Spirochaetia bacterium]
MKYKPFVFWSIFLMIGAIAIYADDIPVTIEFQGVIPNGGRVFVAIYYSADSYRNGKGPIDQSAWIESTAETVRVEMLIPEGECVVSGHQDANGSGKLDFGAFGMPLENIALSNYNGKGIPGSFNKLKVPVYRGVGVISVRLYKVRL